MQIPLLEACVDSYASAQAAVRGGADRLELCANLVIGGTTPSEALFSQIRRDFDLPVNVLIRPRFGDFLYDDHEQKEMCEEVRRFRSLGANGVVIGALTPEGDLDPRRMEALCSAAHGIDVTLHRAFDMTRDPFAALETAVALGCTTILTSGQARDAWTGRALLRDLAHAAGSRIALLVGAGVNSGNIAALRRETGLSAYHTSGRRGNLSSAMLYRKGTVSMGLPSLSEYELFRTNEEEIRACAAQVHGA